VTEDGLGVVLARASPTTSIYRVSELTPAAWTARGGEEQITQLAFALAFARSNLFDKPVDARLD
jgi:hypothetical protein